MTESRVGDRSWGPSGLFARAFAGTVGLCYLALGIAGLAVGSGEVLVFTGGPVLNIVRLVTGLLGLLAVRTSGIARMFGWVCFFAFAGLFAFGVPVAVTHSAGSVGAVFSVGWGDNVLHGVTAVLGLWAAFARVDERGMTPDRG